jgi:hypothetical protein
MSKRAPRSVASRNPRLAAKQAGVTAIATRRRATDFADSRDRTPPATVTDGACLADSSDLRQLLAALRPLGQGTTLALHAAHCARCFARLCDLFLATAPAESDPLLRIIDGVNRSVYRLAKALLRDSADPALIAFCFDQTPEAVTSVVAEALDRLAALDEYTEGRSQTSCEASALRLLVTTAAGDHPECSEDDLVESLLRRAIGIGGRHGLDAANLLGFLLFTRGDLDGAELLLTTVCRRVAADAYERETQAHAMNNLAGVFVHRGNPRSAILWCERSLMLKERLGLDARTNYLNLVVFWLEQGTTYATERVRHYLRSLLLLERGKDYLERNLRSEPYAATRRRFVDAGFAKEFPEILLETPTPKPESRLKRLRRLEE